MYAIWETHDSAFSLLTVQILVFTKLLYLYIGQISGFFFFFKRQKFYMYQVFEQKKKVIIDNVMINFANSFYSSNLIR